MIFNVYYSQTPHCFGNKNHQTRACSNNKYTKTEVILIRFTEESLHKWLNSYRRKPIVLRGGRQVGKSTLVRMFAENAKLNLVEINLERYLYLDEKFKTFDLEIIFRELEGITGQTITENSLIFLDEVQATPNAIACLRYFYEEMPQIPIIATGSLLEFTLSEHKFSMPVGRVDYRYLGPMTFNEYLFNLYPDLTKYIASIAMLKKIPEIIHIKLLEKIKEYLFIGGMPEAVLAYKETHDLNEVKSVHRSICNTYLDDFSKYAQNKDLLLLQQIFRAIPQKICQKVKYSHYSTEHSSKEIKNCLELLMKAKICNPIYSSSCSGLPLEATISRNTYKLLFIDVGLANHICGLDLKHIRAIENNILINKGQMAEQFIGQHLTYSDDMTKSFDLNYWLRENKKHNAEIDFVTVIDGKIIPIEVKSGKSGTLKSLHQFVYLKATNTAIRFDLNKYSTQSVSYKIKVGTNKEVVEFNLISYPLYAINLLERSNLSLPSSQSKVGILQTPIEQ